MPGTHGGGCGCRHESELVGSSFLLPFIDKDGIRALNEVCMGSSRTIFKSYEDRLNDELGTCSSNIGEPELIIHVPFTSPCKVSSIHLIGGDGGCHPSGVRVYRDRDDVDFTIAQDLEATQQLELVEDFHGAIEYPLKIQKFQNVNSLTFVFDSTVGGDVEQIVLHYIGIRGECSGLQRKPVTTVYEARANPADHKTGEEFGSNFAVQ